MKKPKLNHGLTLIEVLVVVAIIALLLALVIPAVMASREAARRARCVKNLQQIGIACANYISYHNVFPQAHNGTGYSPQVTFLPFMEMAPLYASINFSFLCDGHTPPENVTAASVVVDAYLCPSDGNNRDLPRTNYAGNRGFGFDESGHANNGIFAHPLSRTTVGYAAISDGSSHTAAFSEWLVGPSRVRSPDAQRTNFVTTPPLKKVTDFDAFVALCNGIDPLTAGWSGQGKGANYFHGDMMSTLYNHNVLPNGFSCVNGGLVQQGAWTAGSMHSGVHVLFADGHVTPIRATVSQAVWRAVGSRNGAEIDSSP